MGTFLDGGVIIKSDGNKSFKVVNKDESKFLTGSYHQVNFTIDRTQLILAGSALSTDPLNLHRLAGHPSILYLNKMFPDKDVSDIHCKTCDLGKIHKAPFSGAWPKCTEKLQILHVHVAGPISPESFSGKRYFL